MPNCKESIQSLTEFKAPFPAILFFATINYGNQNALLMYMTKLTAM